MLIRVKPHVVTIVDEQTEPINEKEIDISKCTFEFDDEITDEYVKEAYFTLNGNTYKQLIQNNECKIPYEVLTQKGELEIGVVAYLVQNETEIKRYNPMPDYYSTWKGSLKDADNTEPITPTDKEQMQQAITDNANAITDLYETKADKTEIPTKLSELDNDVDYITNEVDDLVNYTKTSDLSQVAFTGEYTDLLNKPDLSVYATNTELGEEITNRENADRGLQEQIDAITSSSDVKDIVGTYAELQAYDTSKLGKDDIIKVLQDSTHNNASTYYRWNLSTWVYIGAEGPYYTKSETDTLLQPYVKNTDYATSSKGGVLKIDQNYGLRVSNGTLIGYGVNYNDYQSALNQLVVDKGTLENVITGKELTNKTYVDNADSLKEDKSNKVTSISSSSTDTEYPSAKCMYDSQEEQNEQIEKANLIYNALPRVEGEGTSLSIDNTAKCPMELEPKANTLTQETTTGKNLANPNTNYSSIGGIPLSVEDGIIKLNGTTSSSSINAWFHNFQTNSGNAVFWVEVTGYTDKASGNAAMILQQSDDGSTFSTLQEINLVSTREKEGSVTLDSSKYYRLRFYGASDTTFTNATIKVMLEYGDTKTSWEEYTNGASPNPNYPQEVHVVSGDNNVVVCGKNLAYSTWASDFVTRVSNTNRAKLETYDNKNCVWWNSILGSQDVNKNYIFKTDWLPNTQYTISCSIWSDSNKGNIGIVYTDGTQSVPTITKETWYNLVMTSEAGKTIKYIKATYYAGSTYIDLDTFMVEKNATATTYEPYVSQTYPINLPVENLFDKTTITDTGKYLQNTGSLASNLDYAISDYIPIKPNTDYTLSGIISIGTNPSRCYYDENKTYISGTKHNNNKPFTDTSPSGAYYMRESVKIADLDTTQIEKGDKANTYTPYGTTPIELCKIGDYQDYLYKSNGKWYKYGKIDKVTLDGSRTWSIVTSGETPYYRYRYFNTAIASSSSGIYCNIFKQNTITTTGNNLGCQISATGEFRAREQNMKTLEQWYSYLNSTNLIVYYVLENATTTEITDTTLISQLNAIEKALSYQNQTNITQTNNDLPFVIKASAIYDLSDLVTRVADLEV